MAKIGFKEKPVYENVFKVADYSINDWLGVVGMIGHLAKVCPSIRQTHVELSKSGDAEVKQANSIKAMGIPYCITANDLNNLNRVIKTLNEYSGW